MTFGGCRTFFLEGTGESQEGERGEDEVSW